MSKQINYLDWVQRQNEFSSNIDEIRKEKMPHWGSFVYHVSIPGVDDNGRKGLCRFNIRQIFCESFCRSKNLNYSSYPSAKENASKPQELINKRRHYTSCVYDKVVSFVISLEEAPLVVFEQSNINTWSDIDAFHFDYLRQLLIENGIMFINATSLAKYHGNFSMPVVVVELISNNDRMLYNCETILKASKGDSKLTYISILKEYDRDEMSFLIKEKEKISSQTNSITLPGDVVANNYPENYESLKKEFETLKDNVDDYKKLLNDNGVQYLYHFTDRRKLDSIKEHGGLYSWKYCEDHGIKIPYPGGDESSKQLDLSFNLENYVRLSFCEDHPMSWRLQQQGYDLVLLKIRVDAAYSKNALYSDINAADSNHSHGATIDYLRKIDFSATKLHYVSRESPFFKKHQAEVMLKTFIPIECILNLDNPDTI